MTHEDLIAKPWPDYELLDSGENMKLERYGEVIVARPETQALWKNPGDEAARCVGLLEDVGLRPAAQFLDRYPHELSGGQRQRVSIARSLAMEPRLIIADEPLSGADVSIRGQVLNLLLDIQRRRHVAYLMTTHDISIARAFADRVAVMMKGEMVEVGPAHDVLGAPRHPYTQRLVAAVAELGKL